MNQGVIIGKISNYVSLIFHDLFSDFCSLYLFGVKIENLCLTFKVRTDKVTRNITTLQLLKTYGLNFMSLDKGKYCLYSNIQYSMNS